MSKIHFITQQVSDYTPLPNIYVCVCSGAGAFKTYLTAVMALQYSEEPDYSALKAGLSSALQQLGGSPEELLSF